MTKYCKHAFLLLVIAKGLSYWLVSFHEHPEAPLSSLVMYRLGDIEYFPLIAAMSRLQFGQSLRSPPYGDTLVHGLFFRGLGSYAFIALDVIVPLLYYGLFIKLFELMRLSPAVARLGGLSIILGLPGFLTSLAMPSFEFNRAANLPPWGWSHSCCCAWGRHTRRRGKSCRSAGMHEPTCRNGARFRITARISICWWGNCPAPPTRRRGCLARSISRCVPGGSPSGGGCSFLADPFLSVVPDVEIETRLLSLCKLVGMSDEELGAFVNRPYVNIFWLGHAKYQACAAHTFAPLGEYSDAEKESIRKAGVFGAFNVIVPSGERKRLTNAFQGLDAQNLGRRLDVVVLTKDESLAGKSVTDRAFSPVYENGTFRVWRRTSP